MKVDLKEGLFSQVIGVSEGTLGSKWLLRSALMTRLYKDGNVIVVVLSGTRTSVFPRLLNRR
jgi:hypothetical protein